MHLMCLQKLTSFDCKPRKNKKKCIPRFKISSCVLAGPKPTLVAARTCKIQNVKYMYDSRNNTKHRISRTTIDEGVYCGIRREKHHLKEKKYQTKHLSFVRIDTLLPVTW